MEQSVGKIKQKKIINMDVMGNGKIASLFETSRWKHRGGNDFNPSTMIQLFPGSLKTLTSFCVVMSLYNIISM